MPPKFICYVLVLTFVFILGVNAACVCREKSVDYCTKCKEPTFVRPKPRYGYPNPELELTPIGDTCSCDKLFIEPAALPKPCSNKKPPPKCSEPSPTSSYYPPSPSVYEPLKTGDYYKPAPLPPPSPIPHKSSLCDCSSAVTFPAYSLPDTTYAKPKDSTVPADPISISLALQANKAIAVPEAKLAYGFAKKPIDSMKKITFSNVPEENLFKLKNDVIKFKKAKLTPATPSEEEEFEQEEFEQEELVETADTPAKLTYQQLGYVPEYFKNPKFRKITTVYSDDYYSHEAGYPLPDKVKVDCGFKSGRMAAYIKRKPQNEPDGYY